MSTLQASRLQFHRQRTRRLADDWTCELGSVHLIGSREQCGDHTQLLQLPTAAAEGSGPAIYARRTVEDKRWKQKVAADADHHTETANKNQPSSGLAVRIAAFEGVVLMRLVTFITTSVVQSEVYLTHSRRAIAAAVDLAAKAKSKAARLLYNQAREDFCVDVAGGSLRMPCERRAGADCVVVGSAPLLISNATSSVTAERGPVDAMQQSDVTSASAKVTMSTVLDGKEEQVLGVAVALRVERQLRLDRLDPAVPRVAVRIQVAKVLLGVGQVQLGLLYRIVRWNSGQVNLMCSARY